MCAFLRLPAFAGVLLLESELGESGLSRRVQCFFCDVRSVARKLCGDNEDAFFKLREELHAPVASLVFAPALEDELAAVSEFAREPTVVAHTHGGLGADAGDVGERLVDKIEVKPFFAASSGGDCCVNVVLSDVHVVPLNSFWLTCWLYYITSAPSSRVKCLESELGEGGFLVALLVIAAVAQVTTLPRLSAGTVVAAGRVHFDNERSVLHKRPFIERDTPDAAVPFAPTLSESFDSAILPFFNDGARHRIIVELNGGVGARVVVAGEPVAGRFDVEPVRFAACLVDGAHDAVFDVRGDGGRVGGVLVGEVTHGSFAFLCRLFSSGSCS